MEHRETANVNIKRIFISFSKLYYGLRLKISRHEIMFEILGQTNIKYVILRAFPSSQYKLISWSCIIHSEHDKLHGGDKLYK